MKQILLITFCIITLHMQSQMWAEHSVPFSSTVEITGFCAVDKDVIWLATSDFEMAKTTNGGANWGIGSFTGVAPNLHITSLFAINKSIAWITTTGDNTGGKAVYKTTNGGGSWTNQPTADFSGTAAFCSFIYFWDENNGVVVGDPNGGYFEHYSTSDGGTTWVRNPQSDVPANLTDEWGFEGNTSRCAIGNTIWYGTSKFRVMKSIDKGLTWTVGATLGTRGDIIQFKDANNGIVMDWIENKMEVSSDGGETWTATDVFPFAERYAYPKDLEYNPVAQEYICIGDGGTATSTDGSAWSIIDARSMSNGVMKMMDDGTAWASRDTNIVFSYGMATNLSFNKTEEGISIYPNPNNGAFQVSFESEDFRNGTIELINPLGQTIQSYPITDSKNTSIHASELAKGIYYVKINSDAIIHVRKIIIE